jgi:serine protease Do
MHPTIRRFSAFALAAAVLACSRDGVAATGPAQQQARSGGEALFREAADSGTGAAAVDVQVPTASLAPLIERLKPAVVNISTTTVTKHPRAQGGMPRGPRGGPGQDPFEDFFERYFGRPMPEAPQEFRGQSLGSGFILNGEGFILTNNHVVKDATDIQVMLSDGRQFAASVVGKDQLTDVALIKLNNPPKDVPTVVLGSSDQLRQGDYVLALGSPLGLRDTATLGIVSAKHRSGINPGGTYDDFIQTDAAINPGNSGGPLFNLRGEVVGINTAIVRPDIGQGIGFAVPIDLAKSLLPQLREKGKVTRGYLGVQVSDLTPDLSQAFGLPPDTKGALVQNVVPRGPAAKGGVQPGDLVVSVNGKQIASSGELTRTVALVPPGDAVNLVVVRKGGEKKQLSFKVAQRPEDEAAIARGDAGEGRGEQGADKSPKLGVSLAPITPELARQLGVSAEEGGVVVADVVEGGPAQRAGIRPGDVVLEVNRIPVKKVEDVAAVVGKMKEGDMALLRVRRGDSAVYVAVPVGGRQ